MGVFIRKAAGKDSGPKKDRVLLPSLFLFKITF